MKITMRQYTYITIFVALVLLALLGIALFGPAENALGKRAVSNVVSDFGLQLQNVSLLAPAETVHSDMDTHFAPYVTPELLAEWKENPENAPGRETSSPWPARIDTKSITKQGKSYIVHARVILMTSTELESPDELDNAGEIPVILQLIKEEGSWKIAVYQEQRAE